MSLLDNLEASQCLAEDRQVNPPDTVRQSGSLPRPGQVSLIACSTCQSPNVLDADIVMKLKSREDERSCHSFVEPMG